MAYKVKIDVFEGPFDLLVYLIESAKMNIYDISISEITDQYLEYMKDLDSVEMDNAAQFLLLAATLVELKSKMLLPGASMEDSDQEQEDPRKNLMQKLIEYKQFKEAAAKLSRWEDENLLRWYKPQEDLTEYLQEEEQYTISIDAQQFLHIFQQFLERKERIEEIHRRYQPNRSGRRRSTIREKMQFIRNFLEQGKEKVAFSLIAGACEDRYDVAATFVAMLEMMRFGQIVVSQEDQFGEIVIQKGPGDRRLPKWEPEDEDEEGENR